MNKGTKEFYELQEQFEKDIKKVVYVPARFVRAPKEATTHFYENGEIDKLFRVYMLGYAHAKYIYYE